MFCFICDDVCAQRSTISALILLLIDEINEYLDGFKCQRDGINCVLCIVVVLSIYYVKTLLVLLIFSAVIESGLLIFLILNTDGLSLNLIHTMAIATELNEIDLFASDGCARKEEAEEDEQIQQDVLNMERATPICDDTKIGMNIIQIYNVIMIVVGLEFVILTYVYQIEMELGVFATIFSKSGLLFVRLC